MGDTNDFLGKTEIILFYLSIENKIVFTLEELKAKHGLKRSDFQSLSVQSPDAERKQFFKNGDHATLYTGPVWP